MQAHKIHVVVPESHRVTLELPETIPSGLVELIILVPPKSETEKTTGAAPRNRGRLASLAAELAQDARPFRELTPEERRARLRRLRGAGRGLTSGSEELAKRNRDRGPEI